MEKKITLSAQLKWPGVPDDYIVRFDGHVVGRIRRNSAHDPNPGQWTWALTVPMLLPDWARGDGGDRDESMRALAMAWQRILVETSPQRLARLWEFASAAEQRATGTAQ